MRNFLKWIGILLLVLVGLFIFIPNLFLRVPKPVRSGNLTLPALEKAVTVYFDEYAVPHIYAENEHDLFYATGYIMASERLFQMDITNRAIQGRLAEMNAGLVNADKYLRTWGFHHIGKQMVVAIDTESRQLVQWTCDGINAYIDAHKDNLPLEFRLLGHQPLYWDPSITCGFARFMGEDLNTAWGKELAVNRLLEIFDEQMARDLFPALSPENAPIALSSLESGALVEAIGDVQREINAVLGNFTGLRASNNWTVSGTRTDNLPLLANDMHLGYSQPPVWYELHMVGGRFNVRGVAFPGVPAIMSGHNEHIAWGTTNVEADDTDFYLEKVNPDDSSTYLYQGRWEPFEVREEVIQVRDAEPVTFQVRETVHGVIINDFHHVARLSDQPIAMRWSGQDNSDEVTAFLELNRATNWNEFSAAAAHFAVPGQNMIYADRAGNIGWRPFLRVPIRKGASSLRVLPGASGEYDWEGYVPFEEMPYLYNPPQGHVATANHQSITEDFPYYVTHYWVHPYRIRRIVEMLEAQDEHSMETLMAIQNDVLSVRARDLLPVLLAANEQPAGDEDNLQSMNDALEILRQWDYVMDAESPAATIFANWVKHLTEAIYKDEMDQAGDKVYEHFLSAGFVAKSLAHLLTREDSPWFDDVRSGDVETREDIIRRALETTVGDLTEGLGPKASKWTWGRLHTLTHSHILVGDGAVVKFLNWWLGLNVGPFPMSGSGYTVSAVDYSSSEPFISRSGPSQRSIIDLSNLDNSRMVLPTGQSGHPFDRHYNDQAEPFNAGEYRRVDFSREAVEHNAYSTLILQP
ncbi:MAG: penicillin acylase family protein [Fidelibacterota bacterium]|nr:MAG: penicillin acylase family protein [Candidatus Neomarinimicrobiota bacterium]